MYHKPDPFLKYLCNLRPTFETIKTRRRSSRPIFQPKRQKAAPTSVKQAMLSAPCTICPPSPQKDAPSLKANPIIALRMMVAPIRQKSIAREVFQKTYLLATPCRSAKHENCAGRNPPFKPFSCFYGNGGTKFTRKLERHLSLCPPAQIAPAVTGPLPLIPKVSSRGSARKSIAPSELYFSITRPVQSTAETQPKLQPALLSLSAPIALPISRCVVIESLAPMSSTIPPRLTAHGAV
jgi:hypothetical protein